MTAASDLEGPTRPARRPDVRGAGGLAVALGMAAFVAALLAYGADLNPVTFLLGRRGAVEVPNVVGQTQTRAVVELQDANLRPKVEFVVSLAVARGLVVSQEPAGGAEAQNDDEIVIRVSRGNSRITVPEAGDSPAGEFLKGLEAQGLVIERKETNSETVAADRVIGLAPPPGSVLDGGSKLIAIVSTGPAARPVPDVLQRPVEGAAYLIGRAGLLLGDVSRRDDANAPKGAVIETNPPAGTQVAKDTRVAVVVADGPPPVPLDNLVGRSEEQASSALSGKGFVVLSASVALPVGDRRDGTVLEMSPAAGTSLRPGESVTISVGRAATPTTTTTTTTTVPPSTVPLPTPPAGGVPATTAPRAAGP